MNIFLITFEVAIWFFIAATFMVLALKFLWAEEYIKTVAFAFAFFFVLCLPIVYFTQGVFQ